jgi:cysteine desulfurase / selenocysteine lyase
MHGVALTDCLLQLQMVKSLIGPRTKLVSLVHVSNMLGAILPADEVVSAAHKVR